MNRKSGVQPNWCTPIEFLNKEFGFGSAWCNPLGNKSILVHMFIPVRF